ncbi:MAG: nitronate monooxygenase [Rhodocyclaceae bacterium]|jgi:nitronate monooxygenase|nr:nitronate monooxygenase [Rhodocyclaceae bacterium]
MDIAHLSLPLIASPMFLVSGPELVVAACRSGVIGAFPALNRRSTAEYEEWLEQIERGCNDGPVDGVAAIAPHAVNLIVHRTNPRLNADLEITVKHRVPVVITSLGAVRDVVAAVQSYGGIVLHDVTSARHGEKALKAGVDGLIAVSAGAGGHGGTLNPFALVGELRRLTDKLIALGGAVSTGGHIAAALAMGADLACAGTRFIATRESMASPAYKAMLLEAGADDIVYTPKISGINANFIAQSIRDNGLDLATLPAHDVVDMETELNQTSRAWKDIWSAGHGVGLIHDVPTVAELCARLRTEYRETIERLYVRAQNCR